MHESLTTVAISAADFTPPQGWGPVLKEQLGIDLWRIPVVMVAAVGIYLTFLVAVRLFGQRILSPLGGFDAVVIFMFGAVAGRTVLGHPPSLAAGVIGLLTLMGMEALFGAVQDVVALRRTINSPPDGADRPWRGAGGDSAAQPHHRDRDRYGRAQGGGARL